jgi:hypothetical protein
MNLTTTIKNISASKTLTKYLCVIGALVLLVLTFQAGVFFGFHKAAFAYRFGENYHTIFDGDMHRGHFFGNKNFPKDGFANTHGAIGKIVKINLPTLTILGTDTIEKIITITDKTLIKRFRETATTTNLSIGETVMILGQPTATGEISATLIRLLPDTATSTANTIPMMNWTHNQK